MSDWWYYYGGLTCWFGFAATLFVGLFVCAYYANKGADEYHNKMNTICAPSFFVEEERAADHLTRVKCLSEDGEKKEILIKDDKK